MIPATKELRSLMLKNPSADEVWALARAHGARSLFEDGVKKVLNGTTTVEELLRVAVPPVDAEPERPTRAKARARA
jgi:type II secretory ATPase GspE/PulE/Tfp pilus assembly ATPase PilB-like protein